MSKKRLVIGATGLIGRQCVTELRRTQADFRVLARRRAADAPSTEDWQIAADLGAASPELFADVDAVVCALGTTIKAAGSQSAFAAIDRDLVLQLAERARAQGVRQWLQVSALGASASSMVFYNRIKGETDAALRQLGFGRLDILQPSLLLGERSEHRAGERIAQVAMPLLNPLLQGPLRRYRATPSATVAQKLCALSEETTPGAYIHHFE